MDPSQMAPITDLENLDLSTVDLSRPLIKSGTVSDLIIKKFEMKPNKKGTGNVLNIAYVIKEALPTEDGKTVSPPFEVYDAISLVPTDNYDPRQKLANVLVAATGAQGKFVRAELIGQSLLARIDVEPEADGFPAKNRIGKYFPKKVG